MDNQTKIPFLNQFLKNVHSFPNKIAVIFLHDNHKESITFQELYHQIQKISAGLSKNSKRKERIIICLPPGIPFIASFLACFLSDLIAVPVLVPYNAYTLERVQRILKESEASFVLSQQKFTWQGNVNFLDIEEFQDTTQEILPSSSLEEIAFLQYTSGSTAHPKGVEVSFGNLEHNLLLIKDYFDGGPSNVVISWLPPYHDMGLIGTILFPLVNGATTVQISTNDFLKHPHIWLQAMQDYNGTITTAPNFAYELINRKVKKFDFDLTSMNFFLIGAEPIRYNTLKTFVDNYHLSGVSWEKMYPVYGLAEATLIVTCKPSRTVPKKISISLEESYKGKIKIEQPTEKVLTLTSVGKPDPSSQLLILDQETLKPLPEDTIGEVCLKNESVAKGYWKNLQATQETFVDFHDKKFLRTGDLGFLHQKELYITGRRKDLIIINGKNYFPQDIEEVIEQADKNIRPGCLAAFSITGTLSEELIVVAEVNDETADLKKLRETVDRALWEQFSLVPQQILFMKPKTIFKTPTGKIQRQKTKEMYLKGKWDPLK